MLIRILLFIFLAISIGSCDKSVYISIPEESNKLVLNVIMNKDSAIVARVTRSARLNSSVPMPEISNAVVNLYENGVFIERCTTFVAGYNNVYYKSFTPTRAGATYRVTAEVPGAGIVGGNDVIPDTAKLGELKETLLEDGNWQGARRVSIQLLDDPAVPNYYRIRFYRIFEWLDANGNKVGIKRQQYFEAEDTEFALFNDKMRSDFYTTDALFNGRNPRFSFRVGAEGNFTKLVIEVSALTYSSYNYLNSAYLSREKNEDGLSEKVIVYNNIENGLGIVGGVAQREYIVVQ